jgi:predicted GIY-YIG superfamily endonuclease
MPYLYLLECADGSYYTGSTWDLHRRLAEHQSGIGANHTAKRRPVKLVYCEQYDRIEDAFRREKQVLGWSRKKKEALMRSDFDALGELATCPNETRAPDAFDSLRHCSGQAAQGSAAPTPSGASTSLSPRPLSEVEATPEETKAVGR